MTGQFTWVATIQTLSLCAGIVKKPDGAWRTLFDDVNARYAEMSSEGTWQGLSQRTWRYYHRGKYFVGMRRPLLLRSPISEFLGRMK